MDTRGLELKVGITVIAGIIILVLGSLWGKEVRFGGRYHKVKCIFENSAGLRAGEPVTIAGVKKGRVDKVQLQGGRVIVVALIDKDVALFSDASSQIAMYDLMGGQKLEISPGHSGIPLDLETTTPTIKGERAVSIDLLIAEIQHTKNRVDSMLVSAQHSVQALNALLEDKAFRQPLQRSIGHLASASETLDAMLQQNRAAFEISIGNLKQTSEQVAGLMQRHGPALDSALAKLPPILTRLDSLSQSLDHMRRQIDHGEGTFSKLVYSDELYDVVQHAALQLDSLSVDLKKNLGRYLQGSDIKLINLIDF